MDDAERARLAELYEAARCTWPEIGVPIDVFLAWLEARCPAAEDRAKVRADELYLACACASGDARALATFERRYMAEVPSYLPSYATGRARADEVVQRVRERLFVEGKIAAYSGRGALSSWLRVVTVRVASNLTRGEDAHDALEDAVAAPELDPELGVIQRRYGEAFRAAIRDAITLLEKQDRTLLRLHYLDGLNIDRIAIVFQVSRATIGRRMIAVRERVQEEPYRLLPERLKVNKEELASLLRLVRSGLELSLSVVLRDTGTIER